MAVLRSYSISPDAGLMSDVGYDFDTDCTDGCKNCIYDDCEFREEEDEEE